MGESPVPHPEGCAQPALAVTVRKADARREHHRSQVERVRLPAAVYGEAICVSYGEPASGIRPGVAPAEAPTAVAAALALESCRALRALGCLQQHLPLVF